jgi:hypothetical protein
MLRALLALPVLFVVLGGVAASSAANVGAACGRATPIDRSAPLGRAVPLARTLWLAVYPFSAGYPTKTIVMAQHSFSGRIVLLGRSCDDGRRLRFWYRDHLPFAQVPVSPGALRRTGSFTAAFGPWPKQTMRGGYFMFWRSGLWRIVGYRNGRPIGTAIVRSAPD